MILKSLYDYYHRLQALDSSLPRPGYKRMEIPFIIVIDEDGKFQRIEDRRINKKESESFLVINESRTGTALNPYPMYDNVPYLTGYNDSGDDKIRQKNISFIKRCKAISDKYPGCKCFRAVTMFYEKEETKSLFQDPLWKDVVNKTGANLSFLLLGETQIAASKKELDGEIKAGEGSEQTICLLTGLKSPIVKTSTPTMIPGSQATAKLVSFQINSGYDSYGKTQGTNAPISFEAEASYSLALLRLLSKNSKNKFSLGNRTFIFWASSPSYGTNKMEEGILSLCGYLEDDDPNKGIDKVRAVFNSIYNGHSSTTSQDKFYILGLAPNIARIAVTYWNETSAQDFLKIILRHFDDMEIVDSRKEQNLQYIGLRSILSAVTPGGSLSDVLPNLTDSVIRSILEGTPYPYTLYLSALRRIRAELSDSIRTGRVAILKAYINRISPNNKLKVMLDKTNTNIGYVCGRLFAIMEYAQKRANNNASIKERYMNSASNTPAAVFATLLNLSSHHVEKLDTGARTFIEKMKQEIICMLPSEGFPAHLSIQDQGRFFVGYYQQMQDLYTSKENKE